MIQISYILTEILSSIWFRHAAMLKFLKKFVVYLDSTKLKELISIVVCRRYTIFFLKKSILYKFQEDKIMWVQDYDMHVHSFNFLKNQVHTLSWWMGPRWWIMVCKESGFKENCLVLNWYVAKYVLII
jgi:hypothetical protein